VQVASGIGAGARCGTMQGVFPQLPAHRQLVCLPRITTSIQAAATCIWPKPPAPFHCPSHSAGVPFQDAAGGGHLLPIFQGPCAPRPRQHPLPERHRQRHRQQLLLPLHCGPLLCTCWPGGYHPPAHPHRSCGFALAAPPCPAGIMCEWWDGEAVAAALHTSKRQACSCCSLQIRSTQRDILSSNANTNLPLTQPCPCVYVLLLLLLLPHRRWCPCPPSAPWTG
jgi:hypothetical protein